METKLASRPEQQAAGAESNLWPAVSTESIEQELAQNKQEDEALWLQLCDLLRIQLGDATFQSWIQPLSCDGVDGGELLVSAPSRFVKEWVLTHFQDRMLQIAQSINPRIYGIHLQISEREQAPLHSNMNRNEQADHSLLNLHSKPLEQLPTNLNQRLDNRFTFDNFIVGPSNELAYAAAKNIAESGSVVAGANPLFIYGGVGLGKTHLMQAIAHHIQANQPQRRIVYLSAEKFMYQFIRALKEKDIVAFKEMFRSVDVLMVDDVQFMCGKTSTQEEFFHTFNALVDEGKQLILTGDRSPSDLEGMEERMRSRLGWGLVVDVNTTTYELRLGILESKVELMGENVDKEVLEFIADKITSNVRELEGALNKVIARCHLIGQPITLESTEDALRDLLRASEKQLTLETIKQVVAEYYGIKLTDMTSSKRVRSIARPRQVAMYLCKQLTPKSLPEIGRKFGGKDHTTVIHAVRRVAELQQEQADLAEDIRLLTRQLQQL